MLYFLDLVSKLGVEILIAYTGFIFEGTSTLRRQRWLGLDGS